MEDMMVIVQVLIRAIVHRTMDSNAVFLIKIVFIIIIINLLTKINNVHQIISTIDRVQTGTRTDHTGIKTDNSGDNKDLITIKMVHRTTNIGICLIQGHIQTCGHFLIKTGKIMVIRCRTLDSQDIGGTARITLVTNNDLIKIKEAHITLGRRTIGISKRRIGLRELVETKMIQIGLKRQLRTGQIMTGTIGAGAIVKHRFEGKID